MESGKESLLITGASGFIGRNLRESFLRDEYELLCPSSKDLNLIDETSVAKYFSEHRVDYVVHSACMPGHRAAGNEGKVFYANTRMFFNLERQKHNYKRMLVIGSGAIYDNRNYRPKMKEEEYEEFLPVDEHGFSKYVCEKAIENSDNIIDLRVFGIFGKYEEFRIRFISNLICKALHSMPLTMNQNRKFDFLWIDDLIPVISKLLKKDSLKYKAYNVTPDSSESLLNIAEYIQSKINPRLEIQVKQEGFGLEYSGLNHRLKSELPDWKPTDLHLAINLLIEWYEKGLEQFPREALTSIDG
ncbi:MAG: epimerase [Bdellovibrionaceae bacterium]|nr:epimerase [Pseudobdellovibrionaceae bacterium]|tara:strand:+ start:10043 stop:10945 length:903 start_codon:yes stop_codon:yes gene_type:complete